VPGASERRFVPKEEIHIKRVRMTERHQKKVALRDQRAVVSRSAAVLGQTRPEGDTMGTSNKGE
jgi:hypothetical protein